MSDETIDPRYSIGVPEMDREHARWIALIEAFRSAAAGHLTDARGISAARLALEQLSAYTRQHFASEERLLAQCHYPELGAHQTKHHELAAAVAKLAQEIEEQHGTTAPLKLNLFVTVWLLEHIMSEDWKYARFIIGQRGQAPA